MLKVRKPSLILVFAAVLLVLLPLLAYLQYTWLGKVSEGEREQMQASLRRAADEFRHRFDSEIGAIYSSFQPRPPLLATTHDDYVESYFHWLETTRYPRLINQVFIAENSGDGPRIQRLNQITRKFEPGEWPAALGELKEAFKDEAERTVDPIDVFFRYKPRSIDPDIPALFLPILPSLTRKEPAYLIAVLNLDCIQREILPSLAGILSPDYSIKVIDSRNPDKIIFRAGPPLTGNESGDVRTNLFSLRPSDVFGIRKAGPAPLPGQHGLGSEIFSVHVFRNFSGREPMIAGIPVDDDSPAWQLVVTHRSGSVEAAVEEARLRNLAISFGVLLLLAASIAMIIISTERAQRLARQQMEFVSAVSHELRTPLAVICSAGENLADGLVTDPERAQRYGTLVRDEGRRLTGMIEQVLGFAGIQSGRKIYNLRPTDLSGVITKAVESLQLQIQQLGFVIDVQCGDNLPVIMADNSALVRAVQNLIGNALKYSGPSRWIGIRTSSRLNEQFITVEDRGPGIPSDELPHIFEPFYRGRDAVQAQINGSGLGLSLVKEIVEAHGGTVSVASKPGQGCSFQIVFPKDV